MYKIRFAVVPKEEDRGDKPAAQNSEKQEKKGPAQQNKIKISILFWLILFFLSPKLYDDASFEFSSLPTASQPTTNAASSSLHRNGPVEAAQGTHHRHVAVEDAASMELRQAHAAAHQNYRRRG